MADTWKDASGRIVLEGTAPVSVASIALTSDDLLALHTSPKQLVRAPGAGKMIVPFSPAVMAVVNVTTEYTGGDVIKVTTAQLIASEGANSGWIELDPTLLKTAGAFGVAVGVNLEQSSFETNDTPDCFNNQPLIATASANFAGGDKTALLTLAYAIVDTPL